MESRLDATLRRASRGDEAAWRDMVEAYTPRLFGLLYSRCRDPELAEELAQSVFVTVAEKMAGDGDVEGQYVEQGRFESWFFRIAMNRLRDEMRRRARQAVAAGADEEHPELIGLTNPESERPDLIGDEEERLSTMAHLRAAMEQLSDSDREIVELRHIGGLTFRQIADMLDEPLGTVLARQHRALRKLKAWLGEHIEI